MHDPADPIRILAIDDSPLILETLEVFFGDEVETASSVPDALAKLDSDPSLRIVIADLHLAGGGVELLRTIRRRYRDRSLIVVSGDPSVLRPEEVAALGIRHVLDKSVARYADFAAAVGAERERQKRGARASFAP
jgi:DNA-binding NarL/FixJ family response regulator